MLISDRNLNVLKGLALLTSVAERKHFSPLPLALKYPRSDCKFSPLAATHLLVNKSLELDVRSR